MLDYTGERMVPEAADGSTFWEHIQRYRFALPYTRACRVLDIACGEGYGTAAIASSGAQDVIGVDISPEACAHARAKYGVKTLVGSAEAIPLADASVDAVVSFETIEHLEHPERLLDECKRVLAPRGCLVISTPNRPVYHQHAPNNVYHHHEMTLEEFRSVLAERFEQVTLFGQCVPPPRLLQRRGIRRLLTWQRRWAAPHALRPPTVQERSQVPDLIQRGFSWRDRFDPYAVRRLASEKLAAACYLVAVATRGKD